MKKRSLVAMGMAAMMIVGTCLPVYAEEGTVAPGGDGTPDKQAEATDIELTEPVAYTVTIPAKITYNETSPETKQKVSIAEGAQLGVGKRLTISMATNHPNLTLLNSSTSAYTYPIELWKTGDSKFAESTDYKVLELARPAETAGAVALDEATTTITAKTGETKPAYAGTYVTTVQFSVEYGDVAAS